MNNIVELKTTQDCHELIVKTGETNLSISEIIRILDKCGELWKRNGEYYKKAKAYLIDYPMLSTQMDIQALDMMASILSKDSLEKRIISEFGELNLLDDFQSSNNYSGKTMYLPLGILFHVTAGNVFLGAIDSLITGILTKNFNIVKLSSQNQFIPNLFIESLKNTHNSSGLIETIKLVKFKGGTDSIESFFKQNVDGILAWGGEEMAISYQKDLSPRVKLVSHGPKISFHVIDSDYLETYKDTIYEDIATDIGMWNQQACANGQNVFLSEDVDYNIFASNLLDAMKKMNTNFNLSADDWVDKHKERFLGLYSEFQTGNKLKNSQESLIRYDELDLAPTSLNNSIVVKKFTKEQDLVQKISKYKYYLQTCGLGVSGKKRDKLRKALAKTGVTRFTRPGGMLESLEGSAHDGTYSLYDLINIVNDESLEDIKDFLDDIKIPYYKDIKGSKLCDYPIIDGKDLQENSLINNGAFYNNKYNQGYVFSSGGTSGKPKYAFYSYFEFDRVCSLLANSYSLNGITPGMKVANLFMAGNMWSSFNAIQRSLELCKTIQYPIGGLVKFSDFELYIKSFGIECVFGVPSLLLELANKTENLNIKTIFYAGEILTKEAKDLISRKWGCLEFISAGYACVDVGPIGYQDETCSGTEHILFDELIELEVLNGEAVVTSKVRKSMPVIRYRTGDKIRIISQDVASRTKFELLGRVDQKISLWGARFEISEVQDVLDQKFQIIIKTNKSEDEVYDMMELHTEGVPTSDIKEKLYSSMKDMRDTVGFCEFSKRIEIKQSVLLNNAKTGKFKIINDLR